MITLLLLLLLLLLLFTLKLIRDIKFFLKILNVDVVCQS